MVLLRLRQRFGLSSDPRLVLSHRVRVSVSVLGCYGEDSDARTCVTALVSARAESIFHSGATSVCLWQFLESPDIIWMKTQDTRFRFCDSDSGHSDVDGKPTISV